MRESDIQNAIRMELSKHGTFFRANVGQAWTGDEIIRTEGGGVYIPKARPFNTELPKGFSDLFGVVSVLITPEMLGNILGVFTAIEVKTPTGRVRPEQENFLAVMRAKGCIAGIARSAGDAVALITGGKP